MKLSEGLRDSKFQWNLSKYKKNNAITKLQEKQNAVQRKK